VTKNPVAAKETIGDGCCRKYTNSQFSEVKIAFIIARKEIM